MTTPVTVVIVFFFAWWLVLLMVLPFGITPSDTPEKGHSSGAPDQANLKQKLLITTAIAVAITSAFFYLTDGVLIAPDMQT